MSTPPSHQPPSHPAPRHVFMTADAVGGVWTYVADLAAGLAQAGVRTTLAVIGPAPSPGQLALCAGVPGLSLVETGLTLDWMEDEPTAIAAGGRRLAELARASSADLVHLNSPAFASAGAFDLPVVGACHSCLATWWAAVKGGAMPDDFRWRTRVLAEGYRACDRLIAPSAAFAEATSAGYGVDVASVRNGRSRGGRLAGGQKRAHVLTSGRLWDEGKNLAALDAAAARMRGEVRAAGPLIGPGGAAAAVGSVRTLGALDAEAMTEALNAAQVFASLARYEPFGLGVLEAAQAGCALVLSDIPSFRELWRGAAVFVRPDDTAEAAAVMDALLADPDEARRLGALAAERAAACTVEAMTQATLAAYAQALAPRLAGAAA